jgi:hypothetical protein
MWIMLVRRGRGVRLMIRYVCSGCNGEGLFFFFLLLLFFFFFFFFIQGLIILVPFMFEQSPVAALRSPQSQGGRKPSGPRPQNSSGQYSPGGHLSGVKRTRFRASPNQVVSSDESR